MDTFGYILLCAVAGLCILILNKLGSLETRVSRLHLLIERDRQASPQPTEDPRPEEPQSPTASAEACTAENPALNREAEKTAALAESPQPSPELLPAPESSPGPEFSHAPERKGAQTPPRRRKNYEKFIGTQLFAAIGIFVLIVGIGFFIKYAINNDWLDERMRTGLGFASGSALLALAALLQKRYRWFGSLLAGGAFAVYYVTVAVAYHYYELFSQGWAFGLLTITTLLMTAIALGYDRRELAVVALAGGLVAPFITASSNGNHLMLFGYLTILHSGMFVLSLRKKWWELPVISFAATYAILAVFVAYTAHSFDEPAFARNMLGFAALFYLLFAAAILSVIQARGNRRFYWILAGLVSLNNFLFLHFGLLFLGHMKSAASYAGIVPLAIAAANVAILRLTRRHSGQLPHLQNLLLGLTALFLTLAAPIQFRAETTTLCWAAETVVALGLYVHTRRRIYEASAVALYLATALNVMAQLLTGDSDAGIFRSSEFLTALSAVAMFACGAGFMRCKREVFGQAKLLVYPAVYIVWVVLTAGLLYFMLNVEFFRHLSGGIRLQAWLFTSVATISGLLRLLSEHFPAAKNTRLHLTANGIAVLLLIMFSTPGQSSTACAVFSWLSVAAVVYSLTNMACRFYRGATEEARRRTFTIVLNIMATLVWISVFCRLLTLLGIDRNFSTGLSLGLITAGSVQMGLGMLRRQKILRIFSLFVFGLVLLKLVLHDLWQWPTLGRIVVFILLGVTLLLLSFLYQRLKTTLFKDDDELHIPGK